MNKYFKLLNEKFSRLIEEDEVDIKPIEKPAGELEGEPEGEPIELEPFTLADITKEAKKVFQDSNWEIWKPTSENGMILLSKDTRWLVKHTWSLEKRTGYDEISSESWTLKNWGSAYIIINKQKPEKKFLFQVGWGGMYSPSFARYSMASWVLKQNSSTMSRWFANQNFQFVSNRLKTVVASADFKKSGGVYTYPPKAQIPWSDREDATKIIITPGTTRINANAFYNFNTITEVDIPDSVTALGNSSFSSMEQLASIKLPPNLVTIGDSVFHDCNSLKSVIIPNKVRKIGEGVFSSCSKLETLFIPSSVKTMGKILREWRESDTFKNLTIYCEAQSKPDSWDENWNATYVGETWSPETQTWSYRDIKKIENVIWGASKPTVSEELNEDNEDDLEGSDEIEFKSLPEVKVLYEDSEWKIFKSVTFDSIIEYAGSDKIGLIWAESIMRGYYYINGNINERLKLVERDFYNTLQYKKRPYVIIANKKNKINYLFYMIGNLGMSTAEILSNKSNDSIDFEKFIKNRSIDFQNWFKKNYSSLAYEIEEIQIKKNYKGIYEYPNPNNIKYTDLNKFYKGLYRIKDIYTAINIKDGTKQIEEQAFEGFHSVKEIVVPDSVITIGSNAFTNCFNLKKVTLSKNLKTIGNNAFENTMIKNINIPDSVEEIGNECFLGTEIKNVFIPLSVKKLGKKVFSQETKKIYCEAKSKPERWHENWDVTEYEERAEVIWGASRPNITEEVEGGVDIELESVNIKDLISNVKKNSDKFVEDDNWLVLRPRNENAFSALLSDWDTLKNTKRYLAPKLSPSDVLLFISKKDPEKIYIYSYTGHRGILQVIFDLQSYDDSNYINFFDFITKQTSEKIIKEMSELNIPYESIKLKNYLKRIKKIKEGQESNPVGDEEIEFDVVEEKNTLVLYEDKKWRVAIPLTYDGLLELSKGTVWVLRSGSEQDEKNKYSQNMTDAFIERGIGKNWVIIIDKQSSPQFKFLYEPKSSKNVMTSNNDNTFLAKNIIARFTPGLKDWFFKKYNITETMVGYMVF
jgi:hypothetical protein